MTQLHCPCGKNITSKNIALFKNTTGYYAYCATCIEAIQKEVGREDNPEDTDEDLIPRKR